MCACVRCSQPTKQFKSGRWAKYCSATCARKRTQLKVRVGSCKVCGADHNRPRSSFCSKQCKDADYWTRKRLPAIKCKGCGTMFHPKARDRKGFCSRECAFQNQEAWNPRVAKKVAVADGALHWMNRWKLCRGCSMQFYATNKNAQMCSRRCALSQLRRKSRDLPEVMPCDMCGQEFRRCDGDNWITQGKRCQSCVLRKRKAWRKRAKAIRKLRKHNHPVRECESIIEEQVFCSQLWKCGICGESVDWWLPAGHPLSAELDHIVPLSKGGTHTKDNVQCTHRVCNQVKGARSQIKAQRAIALVKWICGCNSIKELLHNDTANVALS